MAKITIDAFAGSTVSDIATQLHAQLAAELSNKREALTQLAAQHKLAQQDAQAEVDQFAEWVADLDTFLTTINQAKVVAP